MEIDTRDPREDLGVKSDNDEIQVLACYRETPDFPSQMVAERALTTELSQCLNDLSIPEDDFTDLASTFTEPSEELIDWFVGNPRPSLYEQGPAIHSIANCSKLDPVSYSPQSPPLADQLPFNNLP